MEHVPDVIFFKDKSGKFLRVNHAFLALFKLSSQDEVIGKTDADFLQPEDAIRTHKDENTVIETGQGIVGVISEKHHDDGSPWWALTSKLPLMNHAGEIIGTCGISKDITELKEAEADLKEALVALKGTQAQLIVAEKAQSIARLAEGVAHEVRNPLAVLTMGMEYLGNQESLKSDENCAAIFTDMQDALNRADRVVETLLQASRPAGLDLERVYINSLVESTCVTTMDAQAGDSNVTISYEWAHEDPIVMADPKQLGHAIEGLIVNALESMPDGGELSLRTRVESKDSKLTSREAGSRCGQLFHGADEIVYIEIEDSGCGIPEAALPRVYDAFFTTKETGPKQGLGLGLTTCRAILELHKGLLTLTNREDQRGAIARVILPRLKTST